MKVAVTRNTFWVTDTHRVKDKFLPERENSGYGHNCSCNREVWLSAWTETFFGTMERERARGEIELHTAIQCCNRAKHQGRGQNMFMMKLWQDKLGNNEAKNHKFILPHTVCVKSYAIVSFVRKLPIFFFFSFFCVRLQYNYCPHYIIYNSP